MVMRTPENQILPIAPPVPDLGKLTRWAGDLTRTLQQNLSSIARKANDEATFVPTADLDMQGFNITNVGAITATTGNFTDVHITGLGANDERLVRTDGTTGDVQASSVSLTDAGAMSGITTLAMTGALSGATTGGFSGVVSASGANLSGLTASQAVATDGSKNLISVANTGTGNNVLAAAPTISGIPVFSGIPSLTGGALTFPATQVASAGANDLDDYEEGTFTPTFAASGSTFSYSVQAGRYVKIGNRVWVDIDIVLNTSGNTLTANALTVTGLPFTAAVLNGQGIYPVRWSASTTSYISVHIRIPGSGTAMNVEGHTAAGTTNAAVVNANAGLHATNGSTFRVHAWYEV